MLNQSQLAGALAVSGQTVARYDYDAFGNGITNTAPELGEDVCPFGFSTKLTDGETGVVYYGFRYYAPEMGRWLSRDPIEEGGGLNLYGMVGNDPVNKWDYLGLRNPTAIEQAVLNGLDKAASAVTDSELKKGIPKVKQEIESKIRGLADGDAGGNDLKAVVGGLRRLFSPSDAEKNAYRDWTVRQRENPNATKYQCSRFVRAVVQEVTGQQFKSQPEAASFVNASSSGFGRDTGINMPIAATSGFGTITAGGAAGQTGPYAAHVVLDLGNGLVVGHHPSVKPDEYRGTVEINGVTFTYDITIRKASRMTTQYPNVVPRSLP
jgi:RHS repeat-associated protein